MFIKDSAPLSVITCCCGPRVRLTHSIISGWGSGHQAKSTGWVCRFRGRAEDIWPPPVG